MFIGDCKSTSHGHKCNSFYFDRVRESSIDRKVLRPFAILQKNSNVFFVAPPLLRCVRRLPPTKPAPSKETLLLPLSSFHSTREAIRPNTATLWHLLTLPEATTTPPPHKTPQAFGKTASSGNKGRVPHSNTIAGFPLCFQPWSVVLS